MKEVDELFDLSGRTALVTGGAGFLGEQFCEALSEAGADVVVADIDREAAVQFADDLNRRQGAAAGIGVDITDPESVREMVNLTVDQFGHLDILVNSVFFFQAEDGIRDVR